MNDPKTPGRSPFLIATYAVIAVAALLVTWYHNLSFLWGSTDVAGGFVAFWKATCANHASTSITLDIVFVCATVFIWMVRESRELKIRFVWAYIAASVMLAVSFALPLFMIARHVALTPAEPAPT